MVTKPPAGATQYVLDVPSLGKLFPALERRGYRVVGPTLRGSAIVYDDLKGLEDLPAGWTAERDAGTYRLVKRDDDALFGYATGAHGWKRRLFPAEDRLFAAQRRGQAFAILDDRGPHPPAAPLALIGMRTCELAAMSMVDRVLLGERFSEPGYRKCRERMFLLVVNCTSPASTCFCASARTNPPAEAGFDLALTELVDPRRHLFVVEAGSRMGAGILAELSPTEASASLRLEAEDTVKRAMAQLTRRLDFGGFHDMIQRKFDHPRWEQAAGRCLACGNCTMVCPTCFCTTVEDSGDIAGARAERLRKWDSCFTQSFSYIHGGSIRMSIQSRFRQRMIHKLDTWVDQFGNPGCSGCGECITWCPAGIDITEEAAALQAPASTGG